MASINKNYKPDAWRVFCYMGETFDGKQIRKSFIYKLDKSKTEKQNEKAALAKAAEVESRYNNGTLDATKTTLQEFAERWLDVYVRPELEATTAARYEFALRYQIYPALGRMKVSEIRPLDVQAFLNALQTSTYKTAGGKEKTYSAETVRSVKVILSSLLSQAVDEGLLMVNPCKSSRRRKHKGSEEKKLKVLTVQEATALLDALDMRLPVYCKERTNAIHGVQTKIKAHVNRYIEPSLMFKTLITTALFAGCRRGELLGLTWSDIDFKASSITINKSVAYTAEKGTYTKAPKTSSGNRTINLPPANMALLKKLRSEQHKNMLRLGTAWEGDMNFNNNAVFSSDSGRRISVETASKKLHSIIKAYNDNLKDGQTPIPDISLHALRHTSGSILIANGLDVTAVASRLGHKDATITLQIYAHAFAERDTVAAATLDNALSRNA